MALKTLGTNSSSVLKCLQWPSTYAAASLAAADIALLQNNIYNDQVPPQKLTQVYVPGAFSAQAELYIPNRGVLQILPGDWIAIDPATGWVFLIAANTIPGTLTATGNTNTNTTINSLSTNVLNLGWYSGMPISGTNVPANAYISAIASNGLSLTLSAAATGSASGSTFTVSNWTHN